MRKYQVVTLPPNARLKLMQMKLPEAAPELLEDTVPPNGGVTAPVGTPYVAADAGVAKTGREATTEAPVVEGSRTNDTVVVRRVQKKRDLRLVVIAAVGICIAVTAIAFLMARPQGDTVEHAAPAHESAVDLKDTASSPAAASPSAKAPETTNAPPSAPTQERPERTLTRSGSAQVDVGPRQQPKPGALQNTAARPVVQPTAPKSPAPASSAKRRPGFDPDRPWWGED